MKYLSIYGGSIILNLNFYNSCHSMVAMASDITSYSRMRHVEDKGGFV